MIIIYIGQSDSILCEAKAMWYLHCVVGCTACELFARSFLYAYCFDGDFCLQLNVCAVRPMIRLNVENAI